MTPFDVQSISIQAPRDTVLAFVRKPETLPQWTNAFAQADAKSALLRTPQGKVEIGFETLVSEPAGSVDWRMTYPDGSVGMAYSRVVADGEAAIYSFILMARPCPWKRWNAHWRRKASFCLKSSEAEKSARAVLAN